MKKSFIIVFIVLFLTPLFFIPTTVNAVGEEWLSEDLAYRKSHEIGNSTYAGTYYQIKLTANYGSGTDSGEDVYLGTTSRIDFGDVRFTEDDGETELDYCIHEIINSSYCIFWVELTADLLTNATIYLYWGNSTMTTTSNGVDTFIQYDDFESYSEQQNLDGVGIWSINSNTQWKASNGGAWGGSLFGGWLRLHANYWENMYPVTLDTLYDGIAYGWRHYRMNDDARYGFFAMREGAVMVTNAEDESGNVQINSNEDYVPVLNWDNDLWMETEFRAVKTPIPTHQITKNGDIYEGNFTNAITVGIDSFRFHNHRYSGYDYHFIDNFYVRKWVVNEPANGVWGNLELKPATYITFYNQTNTVFFVDAIRKQNGTTSVYANNTVIELQGIINVSYTFIEFDWSLDTGEINPFNYTVTDTNATIWLNADLVEGGDPPENGGGNATTLFLFGSVTAIPLNLLYYIALTTIGLTLLLKAQFLGKIISALLFAFQAIWISGDVLLDTQINYISSYNETTGLYQYVNTVTHINTPILAFLIILSVGLALKSALDVFQIREKRKD